ncbi:MULTISPECIES: hypothetical protein [unclassified Haladaptatus]|nr:MULTISPECIES: hypothetical protein [unclassified Haladaptatus]
MAGIIETILSTFGPFAIAAALFAGGLLVYGLLLAVNRFRGKG